MSSTRSPRPLARTALGLLLLAASAAPLAAGVNRWTRIGPYGGIVNELAPAPSRPGLIYAHLAPGGIFRSADAGQTWSLAGSGLVDTYIFSIAVHPRRPTTVYAGTDRGLLRTADGGTTWTAVKAGVIGVFAIDPRSPQVLWGATWELTREGIPLGAFIRSLALDPSDPAVLYAATVREGVFRSADGGRTWSAVAPGLEGLAVFDLAVDPADSSILYAGTYGASVLAVDQEP